MFSYGRDLLLIGLGLQLLNASQAIIITASLGLEAAGLWAVATKAFQLVLQFVQRIFDYTGSAFGEMIVRQEIDTLSRRFRDVLALTAGVAVFACVSVAVANAPFVTMLSHGKYSWEWRNDALVAILIFCNSVSRCYVGLSGYAKQLGRMRWVYLLEGICFVIAASIAVRSFGISGIIAAAIISNLAWSGWYGLRWTGGYLHLPARHIIDWLLPALRYMVFMTAFGVILWRLALHLPAQLRFVVSSIGMLIAGLPMLWFVGFGSGLRAEILAAYRRLAGRQK
jgi:O-antigen/teichoic acid export membrane protein